MATKSKPKEKAKDKEPPKKKTSKQVKTILKKQFGNRIIIEPEEYEKGFFRCSSRLLTAATGNAGGWPRGRWTEIFGRRRSGKTTTGLDAIACAQKDGFLCGLIDLEKFDPPYAERLGVNTKDLIIERPGSSEVALNSIITMIKNDVDLIVLDSIATLAGQKELDGNVGDAHVAIIARQLSQAGRKMLDDLFDKGGAIIFINQVKYTNIGSGMGTSMAPPGGESVKNWASLRIELKLDEPIKIRKIEEEVDALTGKVTGGNVVRRRGWKVQGDSVGQRTKVIIEKNKMDCPQVVTHFDIIFGQGYDLETEYVELGLRYGILQKGGGWVSWPDHLVKDGRGKEGPIKAKGEYDFQNVMIEKEVWDKFKEKVDIEWQDRRARLKIS